MKKLLVPAELNQLEVVQTFINAQLEEHQCPMEIQIQLEIAVEEIFVNIAHYAYEVPPGEATITCEVGGEPLQVIIQFLDHGKPFNPLAKKDADITLSAEERDIGGLGIFMVKKSMDAVDYVYEDGKNIMTIRKSIVEPGESTQE